MSSQLPPDLSKLGDQLARATQRAAAARRWRVELRARLAATAAAAAVALAVLFPGVLGSADRDNQLLQFAATGASYVPTACDQPRGATFAAARPCAAPGETDVLEPDRRYARQ
jgi:hypothetical protein